MFEDRHIEAATEAAGAEWSIAKVHDYAAEGFLMASRIAARSILAHAETLARVEALDLAAFSASEAASIFYPGEDQQAERAAYCRGAADAALQPKDAQP